MEQSFEISKLEMNKEYYSYKKESYMGSRTGAHIKF